LGEIGLIFKHILNNPISPLTSPISPWIKGYFACLYLTSLRTMSLQTGRLNGGQIAVKGRWLYMPMPLKMI
ncbi:Uncharacterized protein APZ42_003680, partial [Daphnia magna]